MNIVPLNIRKLLYYIHERDIYPPDNTVTIIKLVARLHYIIPIIMNIVPLNIRKLLYYMHERDIYPSDNTVTIIKQGYIILDLISLLIGIGTWR